jgi:hypothetical protein
MMPLVPAVRRPEDLLIHRDGKMLSMGVDGKRSDAFGLLERKPTPMLACVIRCEHASVVNTDEEASVLSKAWRDYNGGNDRISHGKMKWAPACPTITRPKETAFCRDESEPIMGKCRRKCQCQDGKIEKPNIAAFPRRTSII